MHAGATQYRCFIHARVRIRRVANLVGAEAILKLRVLRSQPRLRCVLGLPRRGSNQRHHAQRYADGIARPVRASRPRRPPHHTFDGSSSSCRAARRSPLGRRRRRAAPKRFRHRDGRVTTVPFHGGRDIAPSLLRKIARDIQLSVDELCGFDRADHRPGHRTEVE